MTFFSRFVPGFGGWGNGSWGQAIGPKHMLAATLAIIFFWCLAYRVFSAFL